MGCEELEELIEEEFDVSISFAGDLGIVSETAVSEETDPITVATELATYRIESDPDIANAINDRGEISKVTIDRVRYSYKDFEGNEEAFVIESGFTFADPNTMSIFTSEILDSGIRIAEADFRNDAFFHEDDFSPIEAGLAAGSTSIIIGYFGTLSHNPVDFKVGITVDVTVTIKPDI
ncbi:hypothetical protein D7Z94_18580 [Ulvibacterium marinum]|uniref:Uncharacterized protein n=2 Tax=Ulvibacterium marinum TaxID=2419782 RepID=A0A3B0CBB9_9FLAO|nr:hypothetical protein D7Z94_18580 [Ulvibacterium marinum]